LINPYPLFTLNHLTTPVTFVAMISLLLLAGLALSMLLMWGGVVVPPFVPSTPSPSEQDEDKLGEDLSLSLLSCLMAAVLLWVVVVAVSAMVLVGVMDVKDVERCC